MQKFFIALVMVTSASLAGCSSSSSSDSNGNGGAPTPGAGTLDEVVSRSANAQPVDDGLDQVNADLLNTFGDSDTTPIALDTNETVATFIAKQRSSR